MNKFLAAFVAFTFIVGAVAVTYYPTDAGAAQHEMKKKDEKKKDMKKDEKKK